MSPVTLDANGHPLRVQWNGALKATDAEVAAAAVQITPMPTTAPMPELSSASIGSPAELEVTVQAGRRIQSLTLEGLRMVKDGKDVALQAVADLQRESRTLVVSVPDGSGGFAPVYAVPPVPARGVMPQALKGASFGGGVLTLNGLATAKLRLSLAEGAFPESYQRRELRVTTVTGVASVRPRGLELVDPAGTAVWAFPDELAPGAPAPTVDLRFAVEAALKDALAGNRATDVTFRLRGAAGSANVAFPAPHGALVRAFPGVLRSELAGDPVPLELGPLANETPAGATADVTISYAGIRLLDRVADAVPPAFGDVAGRVVGGDAVVRALPPQALDDLSVARVGLIGRAPERCELSMQLVDLAHGGAPLAPPAVLQLEPSRAIATVWAAPAGLAPVSTPVGVSVRANTGRFFWAGTPDPGVRIAIFDADPGGRPLRAGAATLRAVTKNEEHLPALALPPAAFHAAGPVLSSELFLTVDVSDLTLRYGR
ncbi:MAG TPA: hypothetical protein VGJ77_20070 [Gaiellaceae bacterium]